MNIAPITCYTLYLCSFRSGFGDKSPRMIGRVYLQRDVMYLYTSSLQHYGQKSMANYPGILALVLLYIC